MKYKVGDIIIYKYPEEAYLVYLITEVRSGSYIVWDLNICTQRALGFFTDSRYDLYTDIFRDNL